MTDIDWKMTTDTCDVLALSVTGDVVSAQEHGVYVTDEQVSEMIFTIHTLLHVLYSPSSIYMYIYS